MLLIEVNKLEKLHSHLKLSYSINFRVLVSDFFEVLVGEYFQSKQQQVSCEYQEKTCKE